MIKKALQKIKDHHRLNDANAHKQPQLTHIRKNVTSAQSSHRSVVIGTSSDIRKIERRLEEEKNRQRPLPTGLWFRAHFVCRRGGRRITPRVLHEVPRRREREKARARAKVGEPV